MHHVPQLLFRCFRKLFLQYRDTAIHEFLHGSIGKFSVRITPFAVVFIETAIFFLTEQSIIIQRHTAALTKQSLRHPQKCIDGHMKFFGNEFQCFRVWNGFSCFPATHCLSGNQQTLCHFASGGGLRLIWPEQLESGRPPSTTCTMRLPSGSIWNTWT